MKTLRTIALFTVLASMLFAAGAQAAPTIGVYFGADQTPWKTAAPNQPFDIWVILKDIDNTVNAVEYKLNLPTQVIISNPGWPAGVIQIGAPSTGYAVALGECVPAFNGLEVVVQHMTAYVFTLFPEFNVTLTAYEGQQVTPAAPRFANCNGTITNLQADNGILIGTFTGTDSASFGAIKALF